MVKRRKCWYRVFATMHLFPRYVDIIIGLLPSSIIYCIAWFCSPLLPNHSITHFLPCCGRAVRLFLNIYLLLHTNKDYPITGLGFVPKPPKKYEGSYWRRFPAAFTPLGAISSRYQPDSGGHFVDRRYEGKKLLQRSIKFIGLDCLSSALGASKYWIYK